MAKVPAKQPELLSRSEIVALFGACTHPIHRMLLQTVYAAGLRVSEACALRVTDIDSAADCMCLRIASGKGDKGCYSILSPTLLAGLRVYVRSFRPRSWLFCSASGRATREHRVGSTCLPTRATAVPPICSKAG